ncbi:MAG TPA: DUF2380 domain-containing protein [Amaricoccus sp.]|nr:DUF2380 domain-containing protein [Amaricoccus sp.]
MRAVLAALALALAGAAAAQETVAVPALDFSDGSGEVGDQAAAQAARLAAFADALRAGLAASGRVTVVVPDCGDCSPARTPFGTMADAARAAGAELLLVGNVHKISTLIGTVKLMLIDLPGDRVACSRTLSYRGDDDRAWERAAQFAVQDLLGNCLP